MSQTASRLITLIMLLQRRPQQKAADLAAELGVSERTVHRYFKQLEEMGIPLYAERGPAGGFSLVRGYKMPPLVFTPQEAAALYLGIGLVEEIWGPLYLDHARSSRAKLDNVLPDEQREEIGWAQRSLLTKGIHRGALEPVSPRLRTLRDLLQQQERARITYRGRGQQTETTRTVDFYALMFRWGWWYAVGYCHLRAEIRSFRVDRIASIAPAGVFFVRPDDFDGSIYLTDDVAPRPKVRVRMRFLPQFAMLARDNRAAWEEMEEDEDGSIVVRFSTPDVIWATTTVLSYGGAAVVLEPPEVQAQIREWAAAMVAQYPQHAPD